MTAATITVEVGANDLRAWADNPAAAVGDGNPMVPVHPDTLRALANRLENADVGISRAWCARFPGAAAGIINKLAQQIDEQRHASEQAPISPAQPGVPEAIESIYGHLSQGRGISAFVELEELRAALALISNGASTEPAWREKAAQWLRRKAAGQAVSNARWPKHAAAYPEWEKRVRDLERLATELDREQSDLPYGLDCTTPLASKGAAP